MSLSLDLSAALVPLVGQTFVPPKTVGVSDGSGVSLTVELISVESLGVSCEEYWNIDRTSPALVGVVEDLGYGANGQNACLHIVEIPDGVEYTIEEYEGKEHIAEKHRTWY